MQKGMLAMPVISMFYGIRIYIYVERGGKHNVPHIHAFYGEDAISVDFDGNAWMAVCRAKNKQW